MNELERIQFDRKRVSKVFLNNARIFIGAFLLFAVVVVMTTDISLVEGEDIASLGLDFFLLLFCNYAFYGLCADSGIKAGYASELYTKALARFTQLKNKIIETNLYTRMTEFCRYFVADDLKQSRLHYLSVAEIQYEEYLEHYNKLTAAEVKALPNMSQVQRDAILKANKVKPIKFTPKMIMRNGKNSHTRSPLPITPGTKKGVVFGSKFLRMAIFSIGLSIISFQVIVNPSWVIFVSVCIKLALVIVNGFQGHKDGYANIAIDTTDYLECQSDLMEQAIQYLEAHPLVTATND